jgi:hypothetical protein
MKKILFIFFVALFNCNQVQIDKLNKMFSFSNELKEISGIAYTNNLIYVIQDSGNQNKIVVVDTLGKKIGEIIVSNITNNDWEDLTLDKNENLYIGDFGNNLNMRKDLAIYKIVKNDLTKDTVINTTKISFDYPEQINYPPKKNNLMFDVEAFFEYDNHFYLFTKNRSKNFDGTSYVYKIPNSEGHHHAKLIKTINTCSNFNDCAITSAAISADGSEFVLLSHSKIWHFKNFSKDSILDGKQSTIVLNHNSQKEAICFKSSKTIFIADERTKKTGGNLYQVNLK